MSLILSEQGTCISMSPGVPHAISDQERAGLSAEEEEGRTSRRGGREKQPASIIVQCLGTHLRRQIRLDP